MQSRYKSRRIGDCVDSMIEHWHRRPLQDHANIEKCNLGRYERAANARGFTLEKRGIIRLAGYGDIVGVQVRMRPLAWYERLVRSRATRRYIVSVVGWVATFCCLVLLVRRLEDDGGDGAQRHGAA